MTAWTIEVHYQTGNSFNTEFVTENINLAWKDIDLAKECLNSIKEHYDLYKQFSECGYRSEKTHEEIHKEIRSKKWCVGDCSSYDTNLPLVAECDDGEMRRVPTNMWCGYFEKLESAKVVSIGDSDMEITF